MFTVRVSRDDKAVAAYALAAGLFLAEVDREVETIQQLAAQAA